MYVLNRTFAVHSNLDQFLRFLCSKRILNFSAPTRLEINRATCAISDECGSHSIQEVLRDAALTRMTCVKSKRMLPGFPKIF